MKIECSANWGNPTNGFRVTFDDGSDNWPKFVDLAIFRDEALPLVRVVMLGHETATALLRRLLASLSPENIFP